MNSKKYLLKNLKTLWISHGVISKSGKIVSNLLKTIALLLIGTYRSVFTATFGAGVCRFEPSCSEYANQAFLSYGFFKALKITFFRVVRCRPGSNFGYDPVPSSDSELKEGCFSE